jgi:hypothetical protein
MTTNDREVYGIILPGDLRGRITFVEWMDRWNTNAKIGDVSIALGLLHCIYSSNQDEDKPSPTGWAPQGYDAHRHLFLLKLASGHKDDLRHDPNASPRQLKEKAFSVLANHLFKEVALNPVLGLQDEVTEALFAFFTRRGPGYEPNVSWGATQDHAEKLASDFLKKFCNIHWGGRDTKWKLRVLDVLYDHKALLTLIPSGPSYMVDMEWSRFDELALRQLEELTLARHKSIEEAVYHLDQAATLLVIVRAGLAGRSKAQKL